MLHPRAIIRQLCGSPKLVCKAYNCARFMSHSAFPFPVHQVGERKVHGGVPRTASLPQLAGIGSPSSSPGGRVTTCLADCASAPALPPAGLAASRPGADDGTSMAGAATPANGSRPASAPPSGGGRFHSVTAPHFMSTGWPGDQPLRQQPAVLKATEYMSAQLHWLLPGGSRPPMHAAAHAMQPRCCCIGT